MKTDNLKSVLIIFCVTVFLVFNPLGLELDIAWGVPGIYYQPKICKAPSFVGVTLNSKGKFSLFKPFKVYYTPKPGQTQTLALPKGKEDFWYQTRIAGECRDDEFGDWSESVVYSIEFPKPNGLIATRIGESGMASRRFAEHRTGLRNRDKRERAMFSHWDELQIDFPEERDRDGFVYPRWTILEKGSDLDELPSRIERESYYKEIVRRDPSRTLINPEKY